jgi:hypothetical protein
MCLIGIVSTIIIYGFTMPLYWVKMNELTDKLINSLIPFIGNIMARVVVENSCKRAEIKPGELSIFSLRKILPLIVYRIDYYVGKDKVPDALEAIRKELGIAKEHWQLLENQLNL